MTLSTLAAMFGAMLVLAAIPGTSVMAVVSRTLSSGFSHGFYTVAGIVLGDIIFILVAVFGLNLIAQSLGNFFDLIKYLGAGYLIWLGISLWRTNFEAIELDRANQTSASSSFLCGLMITLGDQKAIFFYLGFLPAFVDLNQITNTDIASIMLIAAISIGSVKLAYAYLASKTSRLVKSAAVQNIIVRSAAIVLLSTGLILIIKI